MSKRCKCATDLALLIALACVACSKVEPVPASGAYAVTNGVPSSPTRFYRVVTPAQP